MPAPNPLRRLALRQAKAAAHLQAHYVRTAAGSPLARAIYYSLNRWAALQFYHADGALPIDNKPAENAIRPIALRKNWLFVGSERARRRAAATQSSRATTPSLNGLDPQCLAQGHLGETPLLALRPHRRVAAAGTPARPVAAPDRWSGWTGRLQTAPLPCPLPSGAPGPRGPKASGIKPGWPRLGTRRGAQTARPTAARRDGPYGPSSRRPKKGTNGS